MKIEVHAPRRPAVLFVDKYWANRLKVEEGTKVPCHVLGLYQCCEDTDCAYPEFVCELDDGRAYEVTINNIQFTDVEKGMIIE
jgi:hypothetical protein